MAFKILKDEDKGFNAFFIGIKELSKFRIRVGIQSDKAKQQHGDDVGLTMLELGTIHEFGAPAANIPQRSFIRSTADVNENKYKKKLSRVVKRLIRKPKSTTVKGEYLVVGEGVRKDIINRIRKAQIHQNLAESTKRAKKRRAGGKVEPALIDQGLLIGSISSEVRSV